MQRLTNNWSLKLMAVALASLLSYYVYEYINFPTTQSLRLDLRIRDLPADLVIAEPEPMLKSIEVQVRGPYRLIRQLNASTLSATLNCQEITEAGIYSLRIEVPELTDVQVTDQERKYLDVRVEDRAVKKLDLNVSMLGQIADGFIRGDDSKSANTVTVDGPSSLIDKIRTAVIQVHIEGLDSDLNTVVPVTLWDEQANTIHSLNIKIQPDKVAYSLNIIPEGSIKILNVIPVTVGQPPDGLMLDRLSPNPPWVQVEADRVPEGVTAIPTEPIDLSNARSSFSVTKRLEYPFDASSDPNLPSNCRINLEIVSLEGRSAIVLQPSLEGKEPDKHYIPTPPQLSVESEEILLLDSAAKAKIRAVLFVAGLGLGEHKLTPQLILPTNLNQVKINPSTITVTIIKLED